MSLEEYSVAHNNTIYDRRQCLKADFETLMDTYAIYEEIELQFRNNRGYSPLYIVESDYWYGRRNAETQKKMLLQLTCNMS